MAALHGKGSVTPTYDVGRADDLRRTRLLFTAFGRPRRSQFRLRSPTLGNGWNNCHLHPLSSLGSASSRASPRKGSFRSVWLVTEAFGPAPHRMSCRLYRRQVASTIFIALTTAPRLDVSRGAVCGDGCMGFRLPSRYQRFRIRRRRGPARSGDAGADRCAAPAPGLWSRRPPHRLSPGCTPCAG